LGVWAREAGAATYYGPEISELARQSIDVMKMHKQAMETQLTLDEAPVWFEFSERSMPARFRLDDGRAVRGGLSRLGISLGLGGGQPTTGFAAFAGIQGDYVVVSQFPNMFAKIDGFGPYTGEVVFYGGVAFEGLQVSGGMLLSRDFTNLDRDGYFMADAAKPPPVRPGGPVAADSDTTDPQVRTSTFLMVTHSEGGALGAAFNDASRQGQDTLAALKAEFAPRRLIDRLELHEKIGIPGIGLDLYGRGYDYYGDRVKAMRTAVDNAANTGAALPSPADYYTPPTYEIPIFSRDIAGLGPWVRVVNQVSPKPLFRMLEVGYEASGDFFRVAADAKLFRRGAAYTGCAEAYAALGYRRAWWTLSYSYNTPDGSTFLPIPNAHVMGFQVVYGPPEMARPLVPLMAKSADSKE